MKSFIAARSSAADTSSLPVLFVTNLDVPFGADERNVQLSAYVQDDWSPVRRLTLSAGLRYDVETNGTNQGFVHPAAGSLPLLGSTPRRIDRNNVSPRLGFVWDVAGSGTTLIRGGYGIFYDQLGVWHSTFESSPLRVAFVFLPGTTRPADISIDGSTVPPWLFPMDSVMEAPYTRQFSLGAERVLRGNLVLRVDGQFVQGRNLPVRHERNPVAGGARQFPQFGPVTQLRNIGEAEATLLIFRVRKGWPWGNVDVHYTLADRKASVDQWFDLPTGDVPDTANDFSSEFGPADWDERHRLVLLADLRLPLAIEAAVKIVYSSARPFTAIDSVDRNGDGMLTRPPGEGRNARRGPDFFQVDLGVARYFHLGTVDFGVRLSVYNLLNRTNLNPSSVVQNLGSRLFGQALTALPKRQAEIGVQLRL